MVQNSSVLNQSDFKNVPSHDPFERKRKDRLAFWMPIGMSSLIAVAIIALAWMPVPYVIQSPGPTIDVLGTQDDVAIIDFSQSGAEKYFKETQEETTLFDVRERGDSEGQLRMVTVSERGGPGSTVRGMDWLKARFSTGTATIPFSEIYDKSISSEDVEELTSAQMASSHSTSAIAAFEYLGVPMNPTLTVVGVAAKSDAKGKLKDGDVLLEIILPNGVTKVVDSPSVPFQVTETLKPGATVELKVDRKGETVVIPVVTHKDENDQSTKMGIFLSAEIDSPLEVDFHLEKIGGPSAGLIFALGIIDMLGDTDMTGGENIAGTGAISFAGEVIPVGGVPQKMIGAARDGSTWFLVPKMNCEDVTGNEPGGLRVIPVSTLEESVEVLGRIAVGETEDLPKCEAA